MTDGKDSQGNNAPTTKHDKAQQSRTRTNVSSDETTWEYASLDMTERTVLSKTRQEIYSERKGYQRWAGSCYQWMLGRLQQCIGIIASLDRLLTTIVKHH